MRHALSYVLDAAELFALVGFVVGVACVARAIGG